MLTRTHFVIALFFSLLLLNQFTGLEKFIFLCVALVASFIPDIDSKKSRFGRKIVFRPLQWFVKHRGILHSFIFLVVATLLLYSIFSVVAFGFFVGYGLHLVADCFTIQGVRLFYPSKKKIKGFIRTGKVVEDVIFVGFFVGSIWVVGRMIYGMI